VGERLNRRMLMWKTTYPLIQRLLSAIIISILFTGCVSTVGEEELDQNVDEAIEMLEYVYEGTYNKRVIKESMDILFLKYNIEPVKENYLRVGNALIEYRKLSNGKFQEMDIINDMILSAVSEKEINFDEQLEKSVKKFSNI